MLVWTAMRSCRSEPDIHHVRGNLPVLDPVGEDVKVEGPDPGNGFLQRFATGGNAGKLRNLCRPTAADVLLAFDRESHG